MTPFGGCAPDRGLRPEAEIEAMHSHTQSATTMTGGNSTGCNRGPASARNFLRFAACSVLMASSISPAAFALSPERQELDVTGCLGGIWSLPIDGDEDRWAFAPDEYAMYSTAWIPFLGPENSAHFEVRGTAGTARYWSLTSYGPDGGVLDGLPDDQITLDESGFYSVELRDLPEPPRPPSEPNVLYTGYEEGVALEDTAVIFRTYLGGEPEPPRLWYVVEGNPPGLPQSIGEACRLFDTRKVLAGHTEPVRFATGADQRFEQISSATRAVDPCWVPREPNGWFVSDGARDPATDPYADTWPCRGRGRVWDRLVPYPNPDNKYLVNHLDPLPPGISHPLYVTRFRLPVTPGLEPPGGLTQTRYLSVCTYQLENGGYLVDCLHDGELVTETAEDGSRWVSLVVSEPGDRPSVVDNWLPLASDNPMILIRHLRPEPTFEESPHYFDPGGGESLAEHMGPYFPAASYCSRDDYEHGTCVVPSSATRS